MRKSSKHLTAFVLACAMMTQAAPIAPALAADAEGYTPVVTTDKQYTGYENGNAALDLTQIGRYNSGVMNPDGGSAEIVVYNNVNDCAYVINGVKGTLDCVSLSGLASTNSVQDLSATEIDVKNLVSGFTYGDMTSVAVSPDGQTLAAAIQAEAYDANGYVALFSCGADGGLTFQRAIEVGVQPDMVTFTPDGTKILTANEGEPRLGYVDGSDPAGTVSIIDATSGAAVNVGFDAFDHETLAGMGIILKKNAAPAVDLEPEYIAASNDKAYVSLQEANAIAVIDLDAERVDGIYSAGFEDLGETAFDINKDDEQYAARTYPGVKSIRMLDGISLYEANGKTYLLTANEGDSREWGEEDTEGFYLNELEVDGGMASPAGNIKEGEVAGKVVYFDSSDYDGLDANTDYLFGGRSFTIFEVSATGMTEVYSSGNDFEAKTGAYVPDNFNCSNDDKSIDDRSGKKGPEAESVITGEVDGRTYAFVTLERTSGIMVYDITDPANATYVNYINSRDFSEDVKDDVSVEGMSFVPAADSATGQALLLAACEVSGTMAVYELGEEPAESGLPFTDVDANDWFADAVQYVYDNGLMTGTADNTFAPNTSTTRGMLVSILYRLEGGPAAENAGFTDVDADAWYADAVNWAAANGVVSGYGDTFGANDTLTREQLAAILCNYAAFKGQDVSARADLGVYADAASVSDWATDALSWANAKGLITGMTAETIVPQGDATRAQLAAILERFLAE